MDGLFPIVRRVRRQTQDSSAVEKLGRELAELKTEVQRLARETGRLAAEINQNKGQRSESRANRGGA